MSLLKLSILFLCLLSGFKSFGQELHEKKIVLRVPEYTLHQPVFLTGDFKRCKWTPGCLRFEDTSDPQLKTLTFFTKEEQLEVKFTRGSWTSEGIVFSPSWNPNLFLDFSKQDTFVVHVQDWKNEIGIFEDQVRAYEEEDLRQDNQGKTVFTGSSSIRLWDNFYQDFADHSVLKRGAGGARIKDIQVYLNRLVLKHHPSKIFLYVGENDLGAGSTPQEVVQETVDLVQRIYNSSPKSEVFYISIKPSPSRAWMIPKIKKANALLKRRLPSLGVEFIDVFEVMMNGDEVKKGIWKRDLLHMNQKGYDLWKERILPHL